MNAIDAFGEPERRSAPVNFEPWLNPETPPNTPKSTHATNCRSFITAAVSAALCRHRPSRLK